MQKNVTLLKKTEMYFKGETYNGKPHPFKSYLLEFDSGGFSSDTIVLHVSEKQHSEFVVGKTYLLEISED